MAPDGQVGRPDARPSRRARLLIGLVLLVQVAVPATVLLHSRTSAFQTLDPADRSAALRLGWQMYADSPDPREYRATDVDGKVRLLDPTEDLGALRGRALFDPDTMREVCDRHPEVVRIQWQGLERRCR